MSDDLEARLIPEVRQRVGALGYELVDLRRRGSQRRVLLQVRVDRPDARPGRGITVDECAAVSRSLEAWLDAVGLFGERYVLEVSSPGIERPVRWPEHWARYLGRMVNVRLPERGRVRATIRAVPAGSETVILALEGSGDEIAVPIAEARDATLVVDWEAIERSAFEHEEE